MSVRIFKEEEHQLLFDKQGFIVLPFILPDEIEELTNYFDATHPQVDQNGFFSDSYCSDFDFKKKASDKIVEVFNRAYQAYFIDFQPFGGSFLYKTPGINSELAAHQDWTIVDEKIDIALNCWVPLCDINETNGALMILPGSHYANYPSLRAPTLPFFFAGNEALVHQNLIPFYVPAGTAIILNQSVIHYSQPNTSDKIRKAITAGIKNKGAQMCFHYKVPQVDKLEVFEEEDTFLIQFENFAKEIMERPKLGVLQREIPYKAETFEANEIENMIRTMKEKAGFPFVKEIVMEKNKQRFFQRLFKRIK